MRRLVSLLCLVVACQALPSGTPLANTGGVLDDDGTSRDRRAKSESSGESSATLGASVTASVPRSSPSPVSEPPPDAGAALADAGSGDAGVVASTWPGEYFGSDKLVRHFDDAADDVELDDKAHTRVAETSPGALLVSIVNSASGDTICALRATAHGNEASVDKGQSCFGEEGMTATLNEGRVKLEGERLILDLTIKLVAEADDDGESIELSLEYHFDGKRR